MTEGQVEYYILRYKISKGVVRKTTTSESRACGTHKRRYRHQQGHSYAEMGTAGDGSSFLPACACAIAFCASFFRCSISFTCRSSSAAVVGVPSGRLKVTLLWWLAAPIEPVSGFGTLTVPPVVDRPRWNAVGSTRPAGCWNWHVARVQPAPNLQGTLLLEAGRGWEKEQPGRVQAAPYLQGTAFCVVGADAEVGM